MARLVWDASGSRRHDFGLDRGVLYANNTGYAWPGLISVEEHSSGGDVESFYIDGIKYGEISTIPDFEATIKSYGFPSYFALVDGTIEMRSGLFAYGQPPKRFAFSYRTLMSNDNGTAWYKIHLIYNAASSGSPQSHTTMNDQSDIEEYTWDISTIPSAFSGGWWAGTPTAHLMINSERADPTKLAAVEDLLYGTDVLAPRMPTITEMMSLLA